MTQLLLVSPRKSVRKTLNLCGGMLASRAAKTHASPPRPGANQSAFALAICSAISLNFVSSPTGHISVMHVRGMVVLLTHQSSTPGSTAMRASRSGASTA
jgi:hypothetical protein